MSIEMLAAEIRFLDKREDMDESQRGCSFEDMVAALLYAAKEDLGYDLDRFDQVSVKDAGTLRAAIAEL